MTKLQQRVIDNPRLYPYIIHRLEEIAQKEAGQLPDGMEAILLLNPRLANLCGILQIGGWCGVSHVKDFETIGDLRWFSDGRTPFIGFIWVIDEPSLQKPTLWDRIIEYAQRLSRRFSGRSSHVQEHR